MAIEICQNCRGVWLDRGELERLALTPPKPATDTATDDIVGGAGRDEKARDDDDWEDRDKDDDDDDRRARRKRQEKSKKNKSFGAKVSDAFDEIYEEIVDEIFD